MKKLIIFMIVSLLTLASYGQSGVLRGPGGLWIGNATNLTPVFKIGVTPVTTTAAQFNYLNTLTSNAQTQFNDIAINVKNYGALGNGIANDITAINTAMAAAHAAGKSLYFPAGTYNVGETDNNRAMIRLLPNTPVFGDGDNTIIKRINVSGNDLGPIMGPDYTARHADSTQNNYFISNLKLLGQSDGRRSGLVSGATEDDGGLKFIQAKALGVNKVVIDHVTASGFNKEAIAVWYCQDLTITNCYVVNCNHDAYNPEDISKLIFTGNTADSVNFGMEYTGGNTWTAKDTTDYAIISNNIFKNCYGYGIGLRSGDNISVENNIISAVPGFSITLGQVMGIYIINTNLKNGIRNLQIIGNEIFGFGNCAIGDRDMALSATNTRVDRLSIKNNILHDVGDNAIWLKQNDLTKYGPVDISGNTIYDWNRVNNENGYPLCAIGLDLMDSVTIQNNKIFNTKSIKRNDPLYISNCNNINFSNNDVTGTPSQYNALTIQRAGTNINLYVSNNPGLNGWIPGTNPYRVIRKTIGWHGAAGVDFLQPDVANSTVYPIDLGTIIPAKAKVVDIQIICTEALAGSGLHEILFTAGNATGGAQFIASLSCDAINEVVGIIDPHLPTAIIMNNTTATHVWIGSDPDANWDTYTAGKWEILITVIEYLPFVY